VSRELIRETANEVLGSLESIEGFEEYADITSMYRALPYGELVVRRENPERLLKSLASGEPLEIQFVNDMPYANSVAWNPKADGTRGIDNAFLEGYGHLNNVVMLYGF
jgi:hypothetical protein